jgi:hypothetical protein
MGEQYDGWEAITLGRIQDPSKQVCSGLAADCLPEKERKRIAWARRLGLIHQRSVSVHSRPNADKTDEFVSPNGFAEYYGAPKGKEITRPDMKIRPKRIEINLETVATAATQRHGWKILLAGGAFLIFAYLIRGRVWLSLIDIQLDEQIPKKRHFWEKNNHLPNSTEPVFHPQAGSNVNWLSEYPRPLNPA